MAPVLLRTDIVLEQGIHGLCEPAVVKKDPKLPRLPRFGVRMMLPQDMRQVEYYGLGPMESYAETAGLFPVSSRSVPSGNPYAWPSTRMPKAKVNSSSRNWYCFSGPGKPIEHELKVLRTEVDGLKKEVDTLKTEIHQIKLFQENIIMPRLNDIVFTPKCMNA